jgi:predicted dehydrogenase
LSNEELQVKFQLGILGATGYIGVPYRKEIRDCPDDARIVALNARRQDRLQVAASEDGAVLFSDDWRQVVHHPDVDTVLICTPDALHHEALLACAERGVHVFCEKPVGVDARQAAQMWSAYRDTDRAHYVPFWTRYFEAFQRARKIVQAGTLGEVRAFVYRWQNPRPVAMPFTWRDDADVSSAGSIADVGSHSYDTLRWILGEEARRVLTHADVITPAKPDLGDVDLEEALAWGKAHAAADATRTRKGTAFDYASISIEMKSGVVGTLVLSHAPFFRKGLAPELELHGSEASLSVDRITGDVCLLRSDSTPETVAVLPDQGLGNRFKKYVFPALRERASGQSSEHPGLEDGYRVQLFTDAAARSARQGEWVELASLEAENA